MRIYFLINARNVQLTESVLTFTKGFYHKTVKDVRNPMKGSMLWPNTFMIQDPRPPQKIHCYYDIMILSFTWRRITRTKRIVSFVAFKEKQETIWRTTYIREAWRHGHPECFSPKSKILYRKFWLVQKGNVSVHQRNYRGPTFYSILVRHNAHI